MSEGFILQNPSPDRVILRGGLMGEGSEGKKHEICMYDARVCVCAEREHFP